MKDQMVLVIVRDWNNKEHFYLCEDMETAKRLYPSNEKRQISIKR